MLFQKLGPRTTRVLLNKPKAFNALDLGMVRALQAELTRLDASNALPAVMVFEGEGGKAFCAGGDVRSLYDSRDAGGRASAYQKDFFKEEYQVDLDIYNLRAKGVQQVVFYDGVTMGGGVGISINAPFRIATEVTMFAMPETAIGFFPDVGGSYFLSRLEGGLGMYLALTGARVKGVDAVAAGVATHFVPRAKLPALRAALAGVASGTTEEVESVVGAFADALDLGATEVAKNRPAIDRCFKQGSVAGIVQALVEDGTEWSKQTLATLRKVSPSAVKVTFEQLRRSRSLRLTYPQCLDMEYTMAVRFMQERDFYEGVRCVLVDKGATPTWTPGSLEEVSDAMVDKYFEQESGPTSML